MIPHRIDAASLRLADAALAAVRSRTPFDAWRLRAAFSVLSGLAFAWYGMWLVRLCAGYEGIGAMLGVAFGVVCVLFSLTGAAIIWILSCRREDAIVGAMEAGDPKPYVKAMAARMVKRDRAAPRLNDTAFRLFEVVLGGVFATWTGDANGLSFSIYAAASAVAGYLRVAVAPPSPPRRWRAFGHAAEGAPT